MFAVVLTKNTHASKIRLFVQKPAALSAMFDEAKALAVQVKCPDLADKLMNAHSVEGWSVVKCVEKLFNESSHRPETLGQFKLHLFGIDAAPPPEAITYLVVAHQNNAVVSLVPCQDLADAITAANEAALKNPRFAAAIKQPPGFAKEEVLAHFGKWVVQQPSNETICVIATTRQGYDCVTAINPLHSLMLGAR
jgi:hypothetical protein